MSALAEQLRDAARAMRELSAEASAEHARLARWLLSAGEGEEPGLRAAASVADCMTRKFRQWATELEEAALETEEPPHVRPDRPEAPG